MLQILLATVGALAITASIAAKFVKPPGGAAERDDVPRGVPAWRRRGGAPARQRFSCDRSRTAPRSADVVRAA
jgi:hypothetical protein